MDYGRALRTCRAMRGWDQEKVAKQSGLSKSYISLLESGRRTPSVFAIKKLARGLMIPEALLHLLASDLSSLPLGEGRTYGQLAKSLLSLLAESASRK